MPDPQHVRRLLRVLHMEQEEVDRRNQQLSLVSDAAIKALERIQEQGYLLEQIIIHRDERRGLFQVTIGPLSNGCFDCNHWDTPERTIAFLSGLTLGLTWAPKVPKEG